MGIRVDEAALEYQLKKAGCEDRRSPSPIIKRMLLNGQLPYHWRRYRTVTSVHAALDRAHIGKYRPVSGPNTKISRYLGRTRFICCSHWPSVLWNRISQSFIIEIIGTCGLLRPPVPWQPSNSVWICWEYDGSWRHHCCRRRYTQDIWYRPAQPHEPCLRVHRLSYSHGALHPGGHLNQQILEAGISRPMRR